MPILLLIAAIDTLNKAHTLPLLSFRYFLTIFDDAVVFATALRMPHTVTPLSLMLSPLRIPMMFSFAIQSAYAFQPFFADYFRHAVADFAFITLDFRSKANRHE